MPLSTHALAHRRPPPHRLAWRLALLSLALGASLASAGAPRSPKAAGPERRELLRRAVTVTDEVRDIEVHVAGGTPTTLVFPVAISQHLLVDAKRYFPPAMQQRADKLFVLLPDRDVRAGDAVSLQVLLVDGTLLSLVLSSVPQAADLTVEVEVARQARAAPDSMPGLKAQVADLQGRLDTCQQSSAEAGARKVAALVLQQEPSRPLAFVVERHPARALDKQSRLLVETAQVYRLFDFTYLSLTVENRDPTRLWLLDRAEVAVTDGQRSAEARVLEVAQQLTQGIPPGETSRLVVAFQTPEQALGQRFTLKLLEKEGARHVTLSNLQL